MGPQLWKTATALLSPPLLSRWAGAFHSTGEHVGPGQQGRDTHNHAHPLLSPGAYLLLTPFKGKKWVGDRKKKKPNSKNFI